MSPKLTHEEAQRLIDMLKRTVERQIAIPSRRDTVSFVVVGERKNDEFVVSVERKGRKLEKTTYQGRTKWDNAVLLRLDIDPNGKHTNPGPDGEVICGSHLHIYTEEYGPRFAIPFDPEDASVYDLCLEFFEKFNIVEPPAVLYQLEI